MQLRRPTKQRSRKASRRVTRVIISMEVGLPDFMDTCACWNALIILTSPDISVVAYYFATIALKLDHDLLDSFCEGSIKTETVPLYG